MVKTKNKFIAMLTIAVAAIATLFCGLLQTSGISARAASSYYITSASVYEAAGTVCYQISVDTVYYEYRIAHMTEKITGKFLIDGVQTTTTLDLYYSKWYDDREIVFRDAADRNQEYTALTFDGTLDSDVQAKLIRGETYSFTLMFYWEWEDTTARYTTNFTYAAIELPPDPVRTGYDFVGWYYDEALTLPYQGAPITTDTDLYAKFTPIQYTISYNLNGGTLTSAWTSYNIESAAYTLPLPSRNYYIFDGWYTNASFTGSPITSIASGSTGDKSFYAKYTPITYAITYELNGGTITGQTTSYTVESTVINLPTAYKNGYVFGGWYTAANFSGSPVTTIPAGSNGDKIFYAKYTAIEYSITYYLNGGTLTGQQVTYNIESATYTLPTPTRAGYNFKGWYTDASFTGSAATMITQGSTANKVYYAKWEIITYTVSFYVDGVLYKQLTVGYGSVLDGYYFADGNMQSVSFFADPALTAAYNLGYEIYGDTIIFASTDFDLYVSLTYSVNGIEMSTDLLEYNASLSNLRTFEIDGYDFGGWYYDTAFAKPVQETDKLTSNITIYAKLTEIETLGFWQRVGAWFSSYGWIIIVCAIAVLVLGGISYAVKRKKR